MRRAAAERRVTTICRIEPQYAIIDMMAPSGGWPEDTYKWLRIISNGIDHDALIFEVDGAEDVAGDVV